MIYRRPENVYIDVYIILPFRRRIITCNSRKYVDLSINYSHISNFDSKIIHFAGVISL
jgi:hypothetical protein